MEKDENISRLRPAVVLALGALWLGIWPGPARGDESAGPTGPRTLIQNAALVITMDPTVGGGPLGTLADADVLFADRHQFRAALRLAGPARVQRATV
jgi:hypothetical protein